MNETTSPIPPFWGFSAFTPTIPKLYWNVKSQEQRILNLFDLLNKLVCYAEQMGIQLNVSQDELEKLKAEFEKFQDSGFEDYYEKQIYDWIQANMADLLSAGIKQVYFGLTDDTYSGGAGYFVAYIPDSWSEITFDTGAVYGLDTYGRLILRWDADSPYSVEQKPKYSDVQLSKIIQDVQESVKSLDKRVDAIESGK